MSLADKSMLLKGLLLCAYYDIKNMFSRVKMAGQGKCILNLRLVYMYTVYLFLFCVIPHRAYLMTNCLSRSV